MKSYLQIIFTSLIFYMIFGIFVSPLGIREVFKLQKNLVFTSKQLNTLQLQNNEIQSRINALNSTNIDKEFLDEVLKKQISYSNKNEKLLITNDEL